MVRKNEHAARNPGDLYVTTPEAAAAIGLYLESAYPGILASDWHDPACGFGTLPFWAGIEPDSRTGADLSTEPAHGEEASRNLALYLPGLDALAGKLPSDTHIIANPPFLLLTEFVEHIARHTVQQGVIAAILTPASFWHASKRQGLRDPYAMLALTWRPNFSCGLRADGTDGAAPSADYVWAIYDGKRTGKPCTWSRLARPTVPEEWTRAHERLARIAAGLNPQGSAPLLDT
jgi:hypothetical protein